MDAYKKDVDGVVHIWVLAPFKDRIPAVNVQFFDSDRLHHCMFNNHDDAIQFINLLHIEVLAHIVAGEVIIHDQIIRKVREDNNLWWRPF